MLHFSDSVALEGCTLSLVPESHFVVVRRTLTPVPEELLRCGDTLELQLVRQCQIPRHLQFFTGKALH